MKWVSQQEVTQHFCMNNLYKLQSAFKVFDDCALFIIHKWTQPKLVFVNATEPILNANYNFSVSFPPEKNTKKNLQI